ncbi:MAG: hypothetical protein ABI904_07035 [Chloroflexota bacterium]
MKKRYLYSLLFGIPGFFIAAIISVVVFGAVAGVLWIFVFGDNPWPAAVGKIAPGLFALAFLAVWISLIAIGYVIGRRLEKDPKLNRQHILISGGLTLLFIAFIVFQQVRVGNLGPKSDSALCSDYCSLKGYSGSGMPARDSDDQTCSCYDDSGNEVLKVPLSTIESEFPK